MLSAIGSSTYPSPAGTGQSAAGLQAQLDRYQQKLSDCINCSSAKTLQGQEAIQTLSNKIGEIKARIEQITATQTNTQPSSVKASATTDITAINEVPVANIKDNTSVSSASASGLAISAVGNFLNVFA